MGAISSWVQQLGFLILFAGLVDLILPSSSVRKVTRLVIGFVMILAIMDPLVTVVMQPEWLDELYRHSLIFEGGEPYIEAGTRMAHQVSSKARDLWVHQTERDLALLLTLIGGIGDADVRLSEDEQRWTVKLRLQAAPDPTGQERRALTEEAATRLTRRLLEPYEVDHVQIEWIEATPLRAGGEFEQS